MSTVTPPQPSHRGKRFVLNVLWNWLGVGATLISGLLLSPYMIRKIVPEAYGVWALSFALVVYYWFLDFGLRHAVIAYVALYWVLERWGEVSEVETAGVAYA